MKRNALVTLCFLAVLLVAVSVVFTGEPTRTEALSASEGVGIDAGFRVSIDPITGNFVEEPQVGATALDPLNRSHEGLKVEPAPVGSGLMVDLQGRFQSTYTAVVDENGNLSAGCDVSDEEHQANLETGEE